MWEKSRIGRETQIHDGGSNISNVPILVLHSFRVLKEKFLDLSQDCT